MRRLEIAEQNRFLLLRQREFRIAADVITDAWMSFPDVHAVAVISSVAKALWKEVPRFSEFRRQGIEVWHECRDLDLALWIDSQQELDGLRRAAARALRAAFERGAGTSVVSQQLDMFLIEPGTDRYLGRLCEFKDCPNVKRDCATPGCGAIRFNKVIADFKPGPIFSNRRLMRCCMSAGKGGCVRRSIFRTSRRAFRVSVAPGNGASRSKLRKTASGRVI